MCGWSSILDILVTVGVINKLVHPSQDRVCATSVESHCLLTGKGHL